MKISLNAQIEELQYAVDDIYPRLAGKIGYRKSTLDYHVKRMRAALTTLAWLRENEAAIRLAIGVQA